MKRAEHSWRPPFFPQGAWTTVPAQAVQAALRNSLAQWGCPQRIRVDNGAPWGSQGQLPPALALWLVGLGIEVVWNHPHRPQENGVVERGQGVANQWTEPHACLSAAHLAQHLAWAIRLQREHYPARQGQTRLQAYPALAVIARPYRPDHELEEWSLARVDQFLAQKVWPRRVDKVGYISLYNWSYSVGRAWAGQTVTVRFNPTSRTWDVCDTQGTKIKSLPARGISREQITALNVSRK
jgi:hypothetical protein